MSAAPFEYLHVLGTGNAMVTHCFNTCFLLENEQGVLLVDCGGGNGILRQLEEAGFDPQSIHKIFLTHEHCDHLTGIVWMIRAVATAMKKGNYAGTLDIYCHTEIEPKVRSMCEFMLQKKFTAYFDDRIVFHPVADRQREEILGRHFIFFDIHSTKATQYGFAADLACGRLAFMGDEPVNPMCEDLAQNAQFLLSEAFCLAEDADRFKPYEKHHSTAADAAKLASRLNVDNLVLWHTEESDLQNRKVRYSREAAQHFAGQIFVPDDLDVIELTPKKQN